MGGFTGFGKDALPFFKALAFHQSRDWFQANRALYERDVLEPLRALVADLTDRLAAEGIPLRGDAKSVFRINRDIRFSKDKRPYKTHAGAVLTRSGGKDDPGLLYIHIDPEGCFAAAGFHMPDPKALLALRTAIRRRAADWQKLEKALAAAGLTVAGEDGRLARLPRGFEDLKGSPVEEAIRLKSFTVSRPLPDRSVGRPGLVDDIAAFAATARPLLDFGWKALG